MILWDDTESFAAWFFLMEQFNETTSWQTADAEHHAVNDERACIDTRCADL
jgi:hypothetical protein